VTRPFDTAPVHGRAETRGEAVARRRLLFVAEDLTMAQVVRLVTLASCLDPARYEIHFAAARFPELVFGQSRFVHHELGTLDPRQAERDLDKGKRLYEKRTLLDYIAAERD
jgi:UDP:flavonoid glycosyltransferase YjiC (YdhE family)